MNPQKRLDSIRGAFSAHPVLTSTVAFGVAFVAWSLSVLLLGGIARIDGACTTCHAMQVYGSAAQTSAHQSLPCTACHTSGGAEGPIVVGLAMQRRVVATILGRAPSAVSPVDDRPCRSCHKQALAVTSEAGDVAVRHADFLATSCMECHAGTGHRLAERAYATTNMDDCLTCHRTSATDLVGCTLCHRDSGASSSTESTTTWSVVHGPNWQSTHGAGDLQKCRSCHPRDYCVECHGSPIPHPAPWARSHGEFVVAEGQGSCATCHESEWCDRCHGLPMPHSAEFLPNHPREAKDIADPACLRCHDEAGCRDCHYLSAHPDVPGAGFAHEESGR